jgi:hypothetical protein
LLPGLQCCCIDEHHPSARPSAVTLFRWIGLCRWRFRFGEARAVRPADRPNRWGCRPISSQSNQSIFSEFPVLL